MDTLTRRYGESFMASTKVEFVLTCPAVWSDAAKNTTLQAAERAGMGLVDISRMIEKAGYDFGSVTLKKWLMEGHGNVPPRLSRILHRDLVERGLPEVLGMKPQISAGQLFDLANEKLT